MQRREHASSSKQGKSRRYACQERRPARMAEHRNEGKAKKDVTSRKHHVLPAVVIDLQEELLKCEHFRHPCVLKLPDEGRWLLGISRHRRAAPSAAARPRPKRADDADVTRARVSQSAPSARHLSSDRAVCRCPRYA
jgi:hypothetical protein